MNNSKFETLQVSNVSTVALADMQTLLVRSIARKLQHYIKHKRKKPKYSGKKMIAYFNSEHHMLNRLYETCSNLDIDESVRERNQKRLKHLHKLLSTAQGLGFPEPSEQPLYLNRIA